MYCVCGAIFDEESKECEDGADQEDYYQEVYREEDYESLAHFAGMVVEEAVLFGGRRRLLWEEGTQGIIREYVWLRTIGARRRKSNGVNNRL